MTRTFDRTEGQLRRLPVPRGARIQARRAALPLRELEDVELYPYPLSGGPDINIGPSDPISVIGFPFGMPAGGSLAIWATGFLASEPDVDYQNLPLMLVDCRTRQGQSGSAVVIHSSGGKIVRMRNGDSAIMTSFTKLLGVYSGRINEQSDIGLVWKVNAIAELVSSI